MLPRPRPARLVPAPHHPGFQPGVTHGTYLKCKCRQGRHDKLGLRKIDLCCLTAVWISLCLASPRLLNLFSWPLLFGMSKLHIWCSSPRFPAFLVWFLFFSVVQMFVKLYRNCTDTTVAKLCRHLQYGFEFSR